MVDVLSPLVHKVIAGRYGAEGDAGVVLGTRPISGLWQLAGWDRLATALPPALNALGLDGPGDYRKSQRALKATAWRIAPDRLLIETPDDLAGFGSAELMVLDLGHARAAITLSGPAARDLLSHVVSIDVASAIFPPGDFRQTGVQGVGVLIYCTGIESFDVLVPRTWAETVWEALFDNALPYGTEIARAS